MESFAYPHFSSTVHLALFVNVTNAAKLKARIVRASTMEGAEGQIEREAVNLPSSMFGLYVTNDLHGAV
jgi:EKC/KEOPS complex subunit CGI121/TPRKB